MNPEQLEPRPFGFIASVMMGAGGAVLLFLATRFLIPFFVATTGADPIVAWFLAAGLGVFAPLIAVAWIILKTEPESPGYRRLWLRPMNGGDWLWTGLGALGIVLLTMPIVLVLFQRYGAETLSPDWLAFDAPTPDRLWILLAWVPFFAVNMLGEAFVWHAVLLPRQQAAFGRSAWMVSGACWALFHAAMPWQIIAILVPTLAIIPFVVQRRRNVWCGVILHILVNGPAFVAIVLGFA